MNKHALAILIGLALAGCNSESNTNSTSQPQVKEPVTASQPVVTPVVHESVAASEMTPATVLQSTVTDAQEVSQSAILPISPLKADDAAYKSTGIPDSVINVAPVNCTETFQSVGKLQDAAEDLVSAIKDKDNPTQPAANTTLCLADGTYDDDLELKISGFKVAAENPGQVTLKGGEVSVAMGGQDSQFQGFILDGVKFDSALINTRLSSSDICQDCRISEVSVLNAVGENEYGNLVKVYGGGTLLDHNIFSGKTIKNPMVSLVREKGLTPEHRAHKIVVYKNYFANRPPADGKIYAGSKDNDYEAIRTGLSETHGEDSNSFVVANLFENIQGEAEVISNKASHNTISFNTIRNSYGSLTNRHGHANTIENNFIIGDGYPLAGGIRIGDSDHQVNNNYIEGARYLSSTHHGGIVLLGSDSATKDGNGTGNGYQLVQDVHVSHNTIVDSVNSFNLDGGGKKHQPNHVFIDHNIVEQAIGPVFKSSDRGLPENSEIIGNLFSGQQVADSDGIKQSDLASQNRFESAVLARGGDDNLFRPTVDSPDLTVAMQATQALNSVYDMDGQLRSGTTSIGADEVTDQSVRTVKPLTFADVGPVNYKVTKPAPIVVTAPIKNSNFENWLTDWDNGQGDYYTVTGQNAFSGQTLELANNGSISQEVDVLPNHHYELSAFVKGNYALSIDGKELTKGEVSGDQYKWVTAPYDSESATSVDLSLSIPEYVTVKAPIADPDFTNYYHKDASSWIIHEESGDVGSSSDSAFTEKGSMRLRFKLENDATNNFQDQPGVSQVVDGLPTNTDVTFSMYYCDKMHDDSIASLGFGAKTVAAKSLQGKSLASKVVHNKDLADAAKGTYKDCFKQVSTTFNTGDNGSVELFANLIIDPTLTSDQVKANENYTKGKLEVRIDHFALTYQAKASDDLTANFDEVRLATRTDQNTPKTDD
ncbi:hypothetical protein VHA01S_036_00090 [Vibrio halioticoli NBRC 102217]|uniref:Alginate lyase n=1 Tax=Vibrio halioticoli NBRC 102217 TaxID=1219072 RepID=V5F4I4_9VIBR|nr:polysaccharide lyase 6 family protein [Vibrio halioticoli]GAD90204.1 hypothetical protein VHA01S_036_00090 [Vibrio halioticoli NBRC 102217]